MTLGIIRDHVEHLKGDGARFVLTPELAMSAVMQCWRGTATEAVEWVACCMAAGLLRKGLDGMWTLADEGEGQW